MALKNLIAFGAGEITPELYERGNLDKFRTGLKTLRNATVTKMGGIKSRAGTINLFETKDGLAAKYIWLQDRGWLLEFTAKDIIAGPYDSNLTIYQDFDPDTNLFSYKKSIDLSLYVTTHDFSKVHFTYNNKYVFVFRDTIGPICINLETYLITPSSSVEFIQENLTPPNPWTAAATYTILTTSTGYDLEYGLTFVDRGVETEVFYTYQPINKPINTGERNLFQVRITKASLPAGVSVPDEIRVYNRPFYAGNPQGSGAFLFVGSAPITKDDGTTAFYTFEDYGVTPDPTNNPPNYPNIFKLDNNLVFNPTSNEFPEAPITPKTGLVYQDRLVFSGQKKNRVHATRIGALAMTRDFPMQADSALSFATGSDGALEVNRFYDGRGLLIFTNVGVYESPTVQLSPDTAYAIKRGPYVAEESIEPVQLGGQVTIYDKRLKAVIGLTPSGNYDGYGYVEFSIYSNHLLKGKRIVSWALQDAETQILWMVLDDGTVLSFSYQDEQMVRSWARHDFQDGLAEEVFVMKLPDGNDVVCFCINRDGDRFVERLADRDALFLDYVATDSTKVFKQNSMVMPIIPEAIVTNNTATSVFVNANDIIMTPVSGKFYYQANDNFTLTFYNGNTQELDVVSNTLGVLICDPPSSVDFYPSTEDNLYNVKSGIDITSALVAPVVPATWDGSLTITPSTGIFIDEVGDVLRFYTDTYEWIDLEVTANTLGVLTVTPSSEFPSASATITQATGLWKTYNNLTGLTHLEGKEVSVRVDGFTHASPLNTDRDYETYTVTGGEITLADGAIGSHISVGLPIVTDIETLEVDTVEQYPTKLEGKIVNKVWISYFESLFLYAAAAYPDDDTVTGMENQEYQVEPVGGILFSQPTLPQSERLEMQIQGDWKTRGSIALRNVDPQPVAIRAIIPDIEVIRN